jgi:uncharacterized protein YdgA (DUF945 family)
MKKTLLGGAAAVLIAYLFISWRLGFAIEKQINEPLEQLKGSTPYIEVVANTFRRGWFVSEQDLTVGLFGKLAGAPAGATPFSSPIQIKFHNVIWHGPICGLTCVGLARVRTHISFGPPMQGYLTSAFGSAEPLHIESRMSFGGGGSGIVVSPAIKDAVLSNGAHIAWAGFQLKSEFAPGYNSYSVHGSAPKLSYASVDGNQVELDDIDLVAHSKRALRTLFEGESNIAIGRMSVSAAKAGGAVFNNLRGSYESAVDNGYISMTDKISVGAITASSLNFSGAHFDFSLDHLEADSLEQLSAAMRKVNQDVSRPPEQRGASLMAAMKEPGIVLLSHEPRFALNRFSIATSSGEASLSGTVTLNGVAESDFAAGADPKAMLQKLHADLDMSIDDAFLNALPNGAKALAQLQSFADQGLATHLNGKFHTKIVFQQGMTTFDGKGFPSPPPQQPSPPPLRPAPHR